MISLNDLKSEQEIISQWNGDCENPVVSICCATYNHESYIEKAIKGFLIQKTDFPFEILIHDDASTDKTAEIIKRYELKYPKLIKPIFQIRNQYSLGRKPNAEFNMSRALGQFIAICEGDDYWTDPKKLQIQVDFLKKNSEYVMSCHNSVIVDKNGKQINDSKLSFSKKRDFNSDDLIKARAFVLTMSLVFRNLINNFAYERRMVLNGDTFLLSLLGHYGKCKYHTNISPAVYRVHENGIWSMKSKFEKRDATINTVFWLYKYYKRLNYCIYSDYFLKTYLHEIFKLFPARLIISELLYKILFVRQIKSLLNGVRNRILRVLNIY